jgi:asparagine synthase (glutamine-hydrolysing)
MCGIAGWVVLDRAAARVVPAEDGPDRIAAMLDQIVHRGPDQGAAWAGDGVMLGNRRLAILDLSPAGALPMHSAEDRLHLAYNGEVYNHPALRVALEREGVRYRTGSDAETLLHLYTRCAGDGLPGLAAMLGGLRGMFAFALWDAPRRRLLIARDRAGEKPLFYTVARGVLVFASEIKALLAHPAVPRRSRLHGAALAELLAYGYVPAPETAFEGIFALPPGHMLIVEDGRWTAAPYWQPPPSAPARPYTPRELADAAETVLAALDEAVGQAMLADVPLGAFLSGGLDSSLVVALMRRHTAQPIRTFSIGFEGDDSFDETAHAHTVARALETEHTAFRVGPHALDLLDRLVWHHDAPFGDSSAIPTYIVSQLTRGAVTVALTGDGGDELFAGYERFYAAALAQRAARVPRAAWAAGAALLNALPEATGYRAGVKRARRFLHAAAKPLPLAYFDWVRVFSAETSAALTGQHADTAGTRFAAHVAGDGESVAALLDANFTTYLPGDLLVKTDRASMAVSLETRAPFLDPALMTLAAGLPFNMKLHGATTKHVLKTAARGLLSDAIIDRPKHGFGVPVGAWLRDDSRAVRDLLLSPEARARGLLAPAAVEALIAEHVRGTRDHAGRLWLLLTLESWHRLFIDPAVYAKPSFAPVHISA